MGLDDVMNSNDDDLTNLTWLQDKNLLKNLSNVTEVNVPNSEDDENLSKNSIQISNGSQYSTNFALTSYNPTRHADIKPPYSFTSLIFMAIESSEHKALPVKDVYSWIINNFPYYKTASDGWKNTVRHNLSLNKCFHKVEKTKDKFQISGKGSLWSVDPKMRNNLSHAIKKTNLNVYPSAINQKRLRIDPQPSISLHSPVSENANHQNISKRLSTLLKEKDGEADIAKSMLKLTNVCTNKTIYLIQNNSEITKFSSPISEHNYSNRNLMSEKISQPESIQQTRNLFKVYKPVSSNNKNMSSCPTPIIIKKEGLLNNKRKYEENDEDGLQGAEALLNLSSRIVPF